VRVQTGLPPPAAEPALSSGEKEPLPPPVPSASAVDASPPAAAAALPMRPAFLFGGGGFSSLNSVAKKPARDELVDFTAHNPKRFPASWAGTPTERIREFDQYRLHTPGLPERQRVGMPSSIDRINITNLNHLMVLCGGYGSVRFTSEVCICMRALVGYITG
jgi:hypothetical protein